MVDLALAQGVFRVYLGWGYFGVLQRDSKVFRFVAVLINSSSNTANHGEYVQDMVRRVIVLLDTFGSFGAVLSKCKNAMRHRYIVCLQFAKNTRRSNRADCCSAWSSVDFWQTSAP